MVALMVVRLYPMYDRIVQFVSGPTTGSICNLPQ